MSRHRKPKALRPDEIRAIVDAADEFHRIICRPLISAYCDHYQALHRLNDAIRLAINDISGEDAPWVSRTSSGPPRGALGGPGGSSGAGGDSLP